MPELRVKISVYGPSVLENVVRTERNFLWKYLLIGSKFLIPLLRLINISDILLYESSSPILIAHNQELF